MKATDASENVIKAVGVVLEVTGTDLSQGALRAVVADLATYPEQQVLAALKRCMREVKGKLTLADIINRIDDGRPPVEVAWAMVPKSEAASVCWTIEMRDAYAVCYRLIQAGDQVQAFIAFRKAYTDQMQLARDARAPVKWEFSLGTDKDGRELVILDAADKGRITVEQAKRALPYHREDEGVNGRLLEIQNRLVKQLTSPPAARLENKAA